MRAAKPIRAVVTILAALLAVQLCHAASSDQVRATEAQIEAAYLLNFGKFFTLSAAANRPASFTICVLTDDESFLRVMQATVAGESIDGRPVASRRITRVEDALQCDEVFLSRSEHKRIAPDLAALAKAPVLTVSDLPDFAAQGGMIGFLLQDNRLRFEVNKAAADKAGISFSSQLLKVAVRVTGGPQMGDPR